MFYFLKNDIVIDTLEGRKIFEICSVDEFERIRIALDSDLENEIILAYYLILLRHKKKHGEKTLPFAEIKRIVNCYAQKIDEIIEECGKLLKVPDSITLHGKLPQCLMPCRTTGEKMVADYANMSMDEVRKMQYLEFRFLLAESVKYNMSGSKEGIETLNQCYDEMFVPFDREAFFKG